MSDKETEVYVLICYGNDNGEEEPTYGLCKINKPPWHCLIWFNEKQIQIPSYVKRYIKLSGKYNEYGKVETAIYRVCKIKFPRKILIEYLLSEENVPPDIYPDDDPKLEDAFKNNYIKELTLEDVR